MLIDTFLKRLQDIMRDDKGIDGTVQTLSQIVWMLFLRIYDLKEEVWELYEDDYKSPMQEEFRWRSWAVGKSQKDQLTGDDLLNFVNGRLFPELKNIEITPSTPRRVTILREMMIDSYNYMKDGVCLRQAVNLFNDINFDDYDERHAFNELYESLLKGLQSAGKSGEFYTPRALTKFVTEKVNPQLGEKIADFACGTGGFLVDAVRHLEKQLDKNPSKDALITLQNSIYGVEKKQLPYMLATTNLLLNDIDNPKIVHGNSLEVNVRDYREDDRFDVILMNPPYGGHEKNSILGNFPADLRAAETADLFMIEILYRLKTNGRVGIILPDGFLFADSGNKKNIKQKLFSECNVHTIIRLCPTIFSPYASIATNLLFFDKTGPTKETWFYRFDLPSNLKAFSKTKPLADDHLMVVNEWWNNRTEIVDPKTDDAHETRWKSRKYKIQEIIDNSYNIDLCGFAKAKDVIYDPSELITNYYENLEKAKNSTFQILKRVESLLDINQPMKNENVEKDVDLIRRHNQFINDLENSIYSKVFTGNLSHQDPLDTAQDLLLKHGIQVSPDVSNLYAIPQNWIWVKFSDIVNFKLGKTPPRGESRFWKKDVPWVSITDLEHQSEIFSTREQVSYLAIKDSFGGNISPKGTLLMSFKLTIGKVSILGIDAVHNEAIISIYPKFDYEGILKEYLLYVLPFVSTFGISKNAIKGKTLNKDSLSNLAIPLPPLKEQKEIIERLKSALKYVRKLS